ncbi:MAG: FecR domain-containing protein, partial [Sandaracinaceae bacterium]
MTSQPRRDPHLDRRRVTEPPNLDARVERGWARLEGAPSAPHRASAWWIGGAALAAGAAAVALVLLRPAPAPAAWAGQVLVTEDEPVEVRLRDGSTVAADRGATIHRVRDEPSSTVLRMESGSATYDVRPDAARAFVVWAGDVEVRVIGTRFRVAIEDEGTIAVRVERGGVDVRRGSEVVRVRAGESRRYPPRAGPAEEPGLDVDPGPPEEPRPAQVDDVAPRA